MPTSQSYTPTTVTGPPHVVRVTQNLIVGNTLVPHNLGLPAPFTVALDARTSTGAPLGVSRSLETANTVTITSGVAVTNAQLTFEGRS